MIERTSAVLPENFIHARLAERRMPMSDRIRAEIRRGSVFQRPHRTLDPTDQRRVLGQGKVWPHMAGTIGLEDPAHMVLARDHDVIEAFPADRADQSLRMPVLPRGPPGRRVIAYAHGCKTLRDRLAVASVPAPDHVVWYFIPWERIGDLTGDPVRRRMRRYAQAAAAARASE